MAVQTYVLIDTAASQKCDSAEFQAAGSAGAKWSVRLRTCHGGRSEGVQIVELDNGSMSLDVLPTRGMGIWRVRRGGNTLGWRAPAAEPVHPAFVPLMEPSGLGWLDGFNELLCRCGLEGNGPPEFDESGRLLRPLHGRIANTPAHHLELEVDDVAGVLTLRGVVDEARIFFQSLRLTTTVTTKIGSGEFTWTDEVENIGGRDATLQMLYHFNIGKPLLTAGSHITAPLGTVAPKTDVAAKEGIDAWNIMPPPRPESSEQVYLLDLAADRGGNTCILLSGLADDNAVSLKFNKRTLPCFTVWRNTPAESDGYVVGLEPAINYPNPRTFELEHGRVVRLKPGQKWSAAVSATWHTNGKSIAQVESAIQSIQGNAQPTLLPKPHANWSAGG